MTSHYHYGHAVTGDSPEREGLGTCLTLHCLADCVRRELDHIGDMLIDEAYVHDRDGRDLESRVGRPGYGGTWETVADRYRAALDCHAMISNDESAVAPTGGACRHSWVAGIMRVHDEDLDTVASMRRVECEHCEAVYVSGGA